MDGLIVEILLMLFSVYNACNGLKMSEYEAYWLMDFPTINSTPEYIILCFLPSLYLFVL